MRRVRPLFKECSDAVQVIDLDAEELFKKLRPVVGRKLDGLWLEYQLNPKKRQEIEGLLRVAATKYFDSDGQSAVLGGMGRPGALGAAILIGTGSGGDLNL